MSRCNLNISQVNKCRDACTLAVLDTMREEVYSFRASRGRLRRAREPARAAAPAGAGRARDAARRPLAGAKHALAK
eukprot:975449-Pleurochrysis_carterae.AAC.1